MVFATLLRLIAKASEVFQLGKILVPFWHCAPGATLALRLVWEHLTPGA